MTDRTGNRDRLVDVLLDEVVGGEKPPDLRARILDRARPRSRPWLPVAAAACLFAGIAIWVVAHDPSDSTAPAVPAPEILRAPLPVEARDFRGVFIGRILSVEERGLFLRVDRAVPSGNNGAADPGLFEGRYVEIEFRDHVRDTEDYRALRRQALLLHEEEALVTATVWSERDEALILTRVRGGDHSGPDPRR